MVIAAGALTEQESRLVRGINAALKKAESRFCCGGSFPNPSEGTRIWYTSKEDGSQQLLSLPVHPYDDASIETLMAAGSPVPEKEYVHELLPSAFATNIELGRTFIIDEVQRLLAPGAVLRAQLSNLTVVETGGEQGEINGETEDGGDELFGYLVLGLPVAYTGGDILVTNNAATRTFSWGRIETLQWAAFLACSEFKVSEVTSGNQLKLTYKLYRLGEKLKRKRVSGVSDTLVDAQTLPLYQLLCEARDCSNFYATGRTLGFATQTTYELAEDVKYRDFYKDEKPWLLRGGDAMLFAAGKAAGLKVELRPVYRNGDQDTPALLYVGKVVGEKAPAFLGTFRKDFDGLDGDTSRAEDLPRIRDGVETDADVTWCLRNFLWKKQRESGQYRDEDVDLSWYYATALLVTIPSWRERQEKLSTAGEVDLEPASKRSRIYEEAITRWFQNAEARASREIDYDFRLDDENDEEEDDDDDESEEEEASQEGDDDKAEEDEDEGDDKKSDQVRDETAEPLVKEELS